MVAALALVNAIASVAPGAPTVNVGWTASATMTALTNVILAVIGGGGLKIFAAHLLAMRKIADARANAVDARSDAQNVALSTRVTELERQVVERDRIAVDERARFEKALSDERRDCDRQLVEMRGEVREMQQKMDGFTRQMIAFQSAGARATTLSPQMQRAMDTLDQIEGDKA